MTCKTKTYENLVVAFVQFLIYLGKSVITSVLIEKE